MAIIDKNTIKSWFRDSLLPSESQFHAWLDSFWHQDDKISQSSIEELESRLDQLQDKLIAGRNIEIKDNVITLQKEEETDPQFTQWKNENKHVLIGNNISADTNKPTVVIGSQSASPGEGVLIGRNTGTYETMGKHIGEFVVVIGNNGRTTARTGIALGQSCNNYFYNIRSSPSLVGISAQGSNLSCFGIGCDGNVYIPKGNGNFTLEKLQDILGEIDPAFTAWLNKLRVEIGKNAQVSSELGTAIGENAKVSSYGIAIGRNSSSDAGTSIVIGNDNNSTNNHSIVMGNENTNDNDIHCQQILLGHRNHLSGEYSISVSTESSVDSESINIGYYNYIGTQTISIGAFIGNENNRYSDAIIIGERCMPRQDSQIIIGRDIDSDEILNIQDYIKVSNHCDTEITMGSGCSGSFSLSNLFRKYGF